MRKALTLLTGALALAWMDFCMVLAYRPAWLERCLGGLDKLFRVHKWGRNRRGSTGRHALAADPLAAHP